MAEAAKRVLVVDDEPLIRMFIVFALSDAGFDVSEAETAFEAMELISDPDHYDLLVTDLHMPQADGTAVAERARQHDSQIAVLLVSARSDLLAGLPVSQPYRWLAKPFTERQLNAAVADLVGGPFGNA